MLNGWSSGGVWLSTHPTDMRKSLEDLAALVRNHLRDDPLSGRWSVCINRRKILAFETGGFRVCGKRLEAAGITVRRSPLTNWARRSVERLTPIFEAQCAPVLSNSVIAMDGTTIKAGREDAPGVLLADIRRDRRDRVPLCVVSGTPSR